MFNRCKDCGIRVCNRAKRCRKCSAINNAKILHDKRYKIVSLKQALSLWYDSKVEDFKVFVKSERLEVKG